MSDAVSVEFGAFRQPEIRLPEINTVAILYRHADFVAVNKPAGVSVQQEADAVAFLPALAVQLGVPHLWLVHRLDKVTSGVLLLALNAVAASTLAQMFAAGQMHKTYWAVAAGKPIKKQGWVIGDMAKARRGAWKLLRSCHNPARTRFDSVSLEAGLRCYRLWPQSGKTHQLRVAMKSLGCPILGDVLYGGEVAARVFLHAQRLVFAYQGEQMDIRADAPPPWPAAWVEAAAGEDT